MIWYQIGLSRIGTLLTRGLELVPNTDAKCYKVYTIAIQSNTNNATTGHQYSSWGGGILLAVG